MFLIEMFLIEMFLIEMFLIFETRSAAHATTTARQGKYAHRPVARQEVRRFARGRLSERVDGRAARACGPRSPVDGPEAPFVVHRDAALARPGRVARCGRNKVGSTAILHLKTA